MRVLIVPVGMYGHSMDDAHRLEDWLKSAGHEVLWHTEQDSSDNPGNTADPAATDSLDPEASRIYQEELELRSAPAMDDVDLVVSLGGDGTLLRAVSYAVQAPHEIPVLGLSYGHLGFLTCETGEQDITSIVDQALAGNLALSRRAMVQASVRGFNRQGELVSRSCTALNEVVLSRGASGKIVELSVKVNGHDVTAIRGDGLVVSTATGSTGYALSAGGPIVSVGFKGMICVPIAPHTITARAFLTEPTDIIEIEVTDGRSLDRCVFSDGNEVGADLIPVGITVKRSPRDALLLSTTPDTSSFYDSVSRVFYSNLH